MAAPSTLFTNDPVRASFKRNLREALLNKPPVPPAAANQPATGGVFAVPPERDEFAPFPDEGLQDAVLPNPQGKAALQAILRSQGISPEQFGEDQNSFILKAHALKAQAAESAERNFRASLPPQPLIGQTQPQLNGVTSPQGLSKQEPNLDATTFSTGGKVLAPFDEILSELDRRIEGSIPTSPEHEKAVAQKAELLRRFPGGDTSAEPAPPAFEFNPAPESPDETIRQRKLLDARFPVQSDAAREALMAKIEQDALADQGIARNQAGDGIEHVGFQGARAAAAGSNLQGLTPEGRLRLERKGLLDSDLSRLRADAINRRVDAKPQGPTPGEIASAIDVFKEKDAARRESRGPLTPDQIADQGALSARVAASRRERREDVDEGRAAAGRNKRFRGMSLEARAVFDAVEGFKGNGRPLDVAEDDNARGNRIIQAAILAGNRPLARFQQGQIDRRTASKQQEFDNNIATRELAARERAQAISIGNSEEERAVSRGVSSDAARALGNAARDEILTAPPQAAPQLDTQPGLASPDLAPPPRAQSPLEMAEEAAQRSESFNRRLDGLGESPSLDRLIQLFSESPSPISAAAIARRFPEIFNRESLASAEELQRDASERHGILGTISTLVRTGAEHGANILGAGSGLDPSVMRARSRAKIQKAMSALSASAILDSAG